MTRRSVLFNFSRRIDQIKPESDIWEIIYSKLSTVGPGELQAVYQGPSVTYRLLRSDAKDAKSFYYYSQVVLTRTKNEVRLAGLGRTSQLRVN